MEKKKLSLQDREKIQKFINKKEDERRVALEFVWNESEKDLEPQNIEQVKQINYIMDVYGRAEEDGILQRSQNLILKSEKTLEPLLQQALEEAENLFWNKIFEEGALDEKIKDSFSWRSYIIERAFDDVRASFGEAIEAVNEDIITDMGGEIIDGYEDSEAVEADFRVYEKTKQRREESIKSYFEEMQR